MSESAESLSGCTEGRYTHAEPLFCQTGQSTVVRHSHGSLHEIILPVDFSFKYLQYLIYVVHFGALKQAVSVRVSYFCR